MAVGDETGRTAERFAAFGAHPAYSRAGARGDLRVVALNFDGPAHGLRHSLHSAARLVARTRTGPGHGAIAHGGQQTGIEQAEHVHVPANRSLL
ncbi:hypothetical protein HFK83_12970 [Ralstonia pseudosolanacearum]|uniref:hypothetical protein n=1 Tax=Ralstonia solanacearum species complex TaxID=3116862 RepID=UPI000675E865|nr:hypothetical protein [Ralstonia pseudosolanacearum]MCK4117910.1 hypothetical protein [Ralstonia pseudosolanacearum]MCK4123273.1 hypothetical protein [Ralstonia pseudosolanacearum]